jgi:hypothetical protein
MPKSTGLAAVHTHRLHPANIHTGWVEPPGMVLNGIDQALAVIRSQLRQIAGSARTVADGTSRRAGAHAAQADVMACLATLDQLRTAMKGEAR